MRILITLLLCLAFGKTAISQSVTTFIDISNGPRITDDLLFDNQGNLYGADYFGSAVYKISPSGSISTLISGLNSPNGLALDSQENLYICANGGNQIYKLSAAGVLIDSFTVANPSNIIKDVNSDTLFFTSYSGQQLNKLAPDGTIIPWFSGSPLNGPVGLCYDNQGQLYLSNFTDRHIYKVFRDSLQYLARVPGTPTSSVGFITFAFDCIWATNFQNHKIYRVFANHIDSVVLYAGSTLGITDGSLDSAKFHQPNGIVAKNDSLFISEFATGKIRVIANIDADLNSKTQKLKRANLTLYPNPCKNYLSISAPINSDLNFYKILSPDGRVLESGALYNKAKLSVEKIEPGIYFLILSGKNARFTTRFQKL